MIEAIKQAGGSPRYTEYPGVGHNSWSATYANRDVYAWLFSQKRSD
jgi:predicted peptidase